MHKNTTLFPSGRTRGPVAATRREVPGIVFTLVLVALLYLNSLKAPFAFDDVSAVTQNQTIRQLWPPWNALNPPLESAGALGRPVVNYSLAVNYALGGLDVRVYHLTNLGLHLSVTLALWGILRRALRQTPLAGSWRGGTDGLAWVITLLWSAHPLLTESVTCIVQRSEILGSLFLLLTLYCFIRSVEDPASTRLWQCLGVASCLVGAGSKEFVVVTPLIILLYDRALVAGDFRGAWRRRKGFYLTLCATWAPLAWLVLGNNRRAGTVGFDLGVSSWEYLLTQCRALATYLKLSFWPHPLVLDYGTATIRHPGEVWWQGVLVLGLLAGTAWALVRRPAAGLVGALFFLVLAPSSSFLPLTTQTIAEHRMYLPLAAVLVLVVTTAASRLGRPVIILCFGASLASGWGTVQRNKDYVTSVSIWRDTVAKAPSNLRARLNLGTELTQAQRPAEALLVFEEALQGDMTGLATSHVALAGNWKSDLHAGYGLALHRVGRSEEAAGQLVEACRLNPRHRNAHFNLGKVLAELGRLEEALPWYQQAVKLQPVDVEARTGLGKVLVVLGRYQEAEEEAKALIRLEPGNLETRMDLADLMILQERYPEAQKMYEEILATKPAHPRAVDRIGKLRQIQQI